MVPIGCVLLLVLGCIGLIATKQWPAGTAIAALYALVRWKMKRDGDAGAPKLSTGDSRYPCKAAGGPGGLLQLGDLHGFQLPIHTSSKLAQQLFNAVRPKQAVC